MNDLEKAVSILVCMKHEYPATFRAHELDKVLQHLLDHSTGGTVLLPYIQNMTDEEKSRFVAANNVVPLAGANNVIVIKGSNGK